MTEKKSSPKIGPKPVPRHGKTPRALGPDEKSLWDYAVRDAVPLAPKTLSGGPDPRSPFMQALKNKARSSPQSIVPLAGNELRPQLSNRPLAALDRKTSQKLRNGRIPIDATLDLHGLRQEEAHRRLIGFIEAGQQQRFRCVLVITGKGSATPDHVPFGAGSGRGVLRTALPTWLQTSPLNRYVVKYQAAHTHHGGSGAFYLFLRKLERL